MFEPPAPGEAKAVFMAVTPNPPGFVTFFTPRARARARKAWEKTSRRKTAAARLRTPGFPNHVRLENVTTRRWREYDRVRASSNRGRAVGARYRSIICYYVILQWYRRDDDDTTVMATTRRFVFDSRDGVSTRRPIVRCARERFLRTFASSLNCGIRYIRKQYISLAAFNRRSKSVLHVRVRQPHTLRRTSPKRARQKQ